MNSDGRLEAFVQARTAPCDGWSGWSSLGGWLANPAVGRNKDGRLEVFGVGSDSAVYHIWQNAPSGGWSGWSGLGGAVKGPIAVGSNSDGRLEVFVRGSDNALHHDWQVAPGGAWSGWNFHDGGQSRNARRGSICGSSVELGPDLTWPAAFRGGCWEYWRPGASILPCVLEAVRTTAHVALRKSGSTNLSDGFSWRAEEICDLTQNVSPGAGLGNRR